MESDVIIKDFLLGISPFDQEDDMFIIEDFCGNLENLSNQPQFSFESHDLNDDYCLHKQLTMFSHN